MDWDAENLPERWKRFRQHVELMFSGPLAAKKEEEKCSYLLNGVARKDETLPTLGVMLLMTIKRSLRRILRDLQIVWNRNAIQYFPATSFTKECKQNQKR